MWEQTLSGLIKALRAGKDDEGGVIRQALAEASVEVRSTAAELKAGAVLKLAYLDMLGHGQLAAHGFPVVECMASRKTPVKLIGYLAASQSFGPTTQVSMLTTNLLKKDLVSSPAILATALAALPHLLTPQIYADLSPDIHTLLSHSRPAIRARAIAVVRTLATLDLERAKHDDRLSLAQQHPELDRTMAVWVTRLRDKLLDDDLAIVSTAVNVICELALVYPWPWLELAAELYDLLKLGNNNWMMIKIVKLFTALTPIEPRLTRKLLPALSELISTTNAISLLYECIHTILAGGLLAGPESHEFESTITDKLAGFLTDQDQNLRYIALVGLHKLLSSPTVVQPHLLESHLHTILCLVADPDPSLNSRALDLVEGISYHPESLREAIDFLLAHLYGHRPELSDDEEADEPSPAVQLLLQAATGTKSSNPLPPHELSAHRRRVAQVIIAMGSRDTYAHIKNFEWFLDVLVALAPFEPGSQLADTIIDMASRVPGLRLYALHTLSRLEPSPPIVRATIWICGEYGAGSELQTLLKFPPLDPELQTILLHNSLKLLAKTLHYMLHTLHGSSSRNMTEAIELAEQLGVHAKLVSARADVGQGTENCEMVERAREIDALVTFVIGELRSAPPPPPASMVEHQGNKPTGFYEEPNPFASPEEEKAEGQVPDLCTTLNELFSAYELRPVAPSAQAMVVAPEELELDSWRAHLVPLEETVAEGSRGNRDEYGRLIEAADRPRKNKSKKKMKEEGGQPRVGAEEEQEASDIDVDSIPVVKVDLAEIGLLDVVKDKKKKKKEGIKRLLSRELSGAQLAVDRVGEVPDLSYLARKPTTVAAVPGSEQTMKLARTSQEGQQTEAVGEVVKVVVKKKKKQKAQVQKD